MFKHVISLLLFAVLSVHGVSAQDAEQINDVVRFAVIGDYGSGSDGARAVADFVKSLDLDFIITTGDNNYPNGSAETIDQNIGQFYHEYIFPYQGDYGEGAPFNRFFPTLGNHDWMTDDAQPYLDYFTLPGNERYYDFVAGDVHLFALDANFNEPDGIHARSTQAQWLREQIAASTSAWQIVYGHVPPYSSGWQGSHPAMEWDFQGMGADALISGHDHLYERIVIDGFPYFVNGLGGGAIYRIGVPVAGSQFRYNRAYGAMLVTADAARVTFEFYITDGTLIDSYTLVKP